ncbi:hypothetical protein BpHYR1_039323 [Brachionus plicatilis]|uniref:Uncharacterized protein n=1 Tax=Brachionus plicatilis TaxID=10195 RepID=A0A3M7R567_BRAPC|nr:hypothetical protein BpHYR1_039323 [Brachionus plicatilis]
MDRMDAVTCSVESGFEKDWSSGSSKPCGSNPPSTPMASLVIFFSGSSTLEYVLQLFINISFTVVVLKSDFFVQYSPILKFFGRYSIKFLFLILLTNRKIAIRDI